MGSDGIPGLGSRQGRHDELLKSPHGAYSELIAQQLKGTAKPAAADGNLSAADKAATSSQPSTPHRRAPSGAKPLAASRSTSASDKGCSVKKEGKGYFRRALALNRPELPWVGLGILGALLNGALFPVRDQ